METIQRDQDTRKAQAAAAGFQMLPSCLLNAVTAGKLTPGAMVTYAAIVSFVDGKRSAYVYRRTIAARANFEVSTVAAHFGRLKELGFLEVATDPYFGPSWYKVLCACGTCFKPSRQKDGPVLSEVHPPISGNTHKGTRSSQLDPSSRGTSFAQTSESTTDPSPAQLDPAECQHLAADEDGYCSPCRTQLDQPPQRSQPTEEPLPKADVLVAAVGDVWSMEEDEPQPDPPRAERRPIQNTMPL